jgi:SHS2 domain-containing protein
MEKELFQIATKISTPLILGGIIMIGLYLVITKLLDSSLKDKDITPNKLKLSKLVFRSIVILAVVCLFLGTAGWVFGKFQADKKSNESDISFYLYLKERSVRGVTVKANNLQQMAISDPYGKVKFSFDSTKVDSLFLEFDSENPRISNAMNVAVKNLPQRFDLVELPAPSTTNPTQPVRTRIDITKLNLRYIPRVKISQ